MEVDREELLEILNLIRPALSSKEVIEQSNHFILNKDEILAYNDELLISYPFETGVQCTVDASLFLKLISKMSSSEVSLELTDGSLKCWNNKTRASLAIVENSEIFSYIQKVLGSINDLEWHDLSDDFTEGLRLCSFSAATDRSLGTLTCVRVEGQDIMSGSKVRISWYQMNETVSEDFYIEASLIQELSKYDELAQYALSKSWVHFRSEDGVTFSARRVIPYELLPFKEPFSRFTAGVRIKIPANLSDSIDTANLINEGEQTVDKLVVLCVDKKKITCQATTDKGSIIEEIEFENPPKIDKPFVVTMRPDFLLEVLNKSKFMYVGKDMVLFKSQGFQHIVGMVK